MSFIGKILLHLHTVIKRKMFFLKNKKKSHLIVNFLREKHPEMIDVGEIRDLFLPDLLADEAHVFMHDIMYEYRCLGYTKRSGKRLWEYCELNQ